MPSPDQLQEILDFIQGLPSGSPEGDEQTVRKLLERYGADFQQIVDLANSYTDEITRRVTQFMTDPETERKVIEAVGPLDPQRLLAYSISSALVQMFCFAAEYQMRFMFPELLTQSRIPEDASALTGGGDE